MSEMIERVRHALEPYLLSTLRARDGAATAAIEALRKPTPAMLTAARDWSLKKYGQAIGNDAATGCWQAMHAAALDPAPRVVRVPHRGIVNDGERRQ